MSSRSEGARQLPKGGTIFSLYRPFGVHWLDSTLQETLLPDAPWHKLSEKVCERWATKLRTVMDQPERRQMIFEIVGPDFVTDYFGDLPNEPMMLEEPIMQESVRKLLKADALQFMNHQLNKTVAELGISDGRGGPPEMEQFVQSTTSSINTGMHRHLILGDKTQYLNRPEPTTPSQPRDTDGRQSSTSDGLSTKLNFDDDQPPRDGKKRVVVKSPQEKTPTASSKTGSTSYVQSMPTRCWSSESEVLGLSVRAILERDPKRLTQISKRLHGKFLPSTLRSFMWAEVIFQKELGGPSMKDRRVVREKFSRGISRNLIDMKLKKPSKTPINGLIENAVVEMYDKTSCMQAYNSVPQMKEAVKVLNILYCYNKSYEPHLIYWLYPVQIAMADHQDEAEHPFNVCLFLEMLIRSCYFKWPTIFQISSNVMTAVRKANSEFHDHLTTVCKVGTDGMQSKDFIVDLLKLEEGQARSFAPGSAPPPEASYLSGDLKKEDLSHPIIFVRKWIGEGFVSVLDSQAVLVVWDQLMMQMWEPKVAEHFALALLFLMEQPLSQTQDYFHLKRVLLDYPCELHTKDIVRAWLHLQKGGDPNEIPNLSDQPPQ